MKSLIPLLMLLSSFTPAGAEEYTVYFRQGTNTAALVRMLTPLRKAEPQSECRYVVLSDKADIMAEAINSANAIKAGVDELPCLVLADSSGPYATLPPNRAETAERRNFTAQQYLLLARMCMTTPLQGETLEKCLSTCRALMAHPLATPADKQRLGFECLYPLLLRQYTNMYNGAHTPASEARFLEAIAALETARDIDRNSPTGRKAHDERERLRKTRRQARTME